MARQADVVRLASRTGGPPESLTKLPDDDEGILRVAHQMVEICNSGQGQRAAYCRTLDGVVEAGRDDGKKSLINLMYTLLDRLSAHLYSPTDVRFALDFENEYGEEIKERGRQAARLLGRSWERRSTDVQFSQGVFESLKYGAAFMKQWPTTVGKDKIPQYRSALLMPWQFGVYSPENSDLDEQPALVETTLMTLPEVWRRIQHMTDSQALFARIKATSSTIQSGNGAAFNHPVYLSATPQYNGISQVTSGGFIDLRSTTSNMGAVPDSAAPRVEFHEIWMWNGSDYTTIQYIEPDILIAPRYKVSNILLPGMDSGRHPYTLIQANQTHGSLWGRSEIADLFLTQQWASETAEDIRKLFGIQVDKILAFSGDDINDEKYGQMKGAGYISLGAGGGVNDLTPRFPAEAMPLLDRLIQYIDMICGFDNLLSGRGEPGVRSGAQASPMMKVAGARLKERSLVVERQCAKAAGLRFELMRAKDARAYWTKAGEPEASSFLLSDLPDDSRIVVDGHTTSPVFAEEHLSLIMGGLRMGLVDKVSAIEMLPFQNRDTLIQRVRDAEAAQAAMMAQLRQTDPEGFAKAMERRAGKR